MPRKYTSKEKTKISKKVLAAMRGGLSANKSCEKIKVPLSTFLDWVGVDEKLAVEYARAREVLIEGIADEIMEIADTPVQGERIKINPDGTEEITREDMLGHRRLQVDTRKWLLSKLASKKYGDKLQLSGDAENPLTIQRIERVIVDGSDAQD